MDRTHIHSAMVLAAGFGKRLRPITDHTPKPLVEVGGRTMLDRALDMLVASGVRRAVINVHHLGEKIIDHAATRTDIETVISDERDRILETGGGTAKALPLLGGEPFVLLNADTFWVDFSQPALSRMIDFFDPARMDLLLLLTEIDKTTGHSGGLDFTVDEAGRLARYRTGDEGGVIYAGAMVINPQALAQAPVEPHSLNIHFDAAMGAGRLFGMEIGNGHWFTVGTPQALADAEAVLAGMPAND